MTLHTRLHTVPSWYLPGMPIPVVPARDGRSDMVIIQKLISSRPTGPSTSFISVPARDESANMAIIPKPTVLYTGLILHQPCLTVRARDGQAERTANKIRRVTVPRRCRSEIIVLPPETPFTHSTS